MRGLHEKRCGDSGSGLENEGDAWIGGVDTDGGDGSETGPVLKKKWENR